VLLLIDNYDSFTYNLVQLCGELGVEGAVVRNDAVSVDEIGQLAPRAIIISPGPCTPSEAGVSVPTIRALGSHIPILGVCLGHQAIGHAFGGDVRRARQLMHGKVSSVSHDSQGIFKGISQPFAAGRYHSLVVAAPLPADLEVSAQTDDGTVMGLRHRTWPLHGVQFHPESVLTSEGHQMLRNFLEL
jgi:anthranilate synthase component 2